MAWIFRSTEVYTKLCRSGHQHRPLLFCQPEILCAESAFRDGIFVLPEYIVQCISGDSMGFMPVVFAKSKRYKNKAKGSLNRIKFMFSTN